MPASRHMPPPKITVALRVARMLADGWHIEPCGRVSPPSHEQRKRGPFPGLAGLPSPRASDCSSVRLPPPCSINCVRGSSAASSALHSRNPRYASALRFAPEFAPSWPAGAFFSSHITAGIAGKGHASPGLHDPHGPRCLFRRFSPQSPGEDHRSLQRHGHGLAGWHVKVPKQKIPGGAGTKPAKRRDRSPAAG